jgi:hypothetical protein
MELYENHPVNKRVYSNIYELLDNNPNLQKQETAIIYLINWPYGFGSALIIYIQNAIFLKRLNKNLIVIPHYSNNTRNFKYHDKTLNNSFFKYFKSNQVLTIDNTTNIYFAKTVVLADEGKMSFQIPIKSNEINKRFVEYFLDSYTPIVNNKVKEFMDKINQSKPIIGIHIRSIAQKRMECDGYLQVEFENRLHDVKRKIENNYPNANIFIATDVELYITKMKELFGKDNVYYLDYIKRIYNEGDSIPQLDKYKGYTLGSEIMDDCYALSLCDKIYISNSNIPFLVTLMNDTVKMEEY